MAPDTLYARTHRQKTVLVSQCSGSPPNACMWELTRSWLSIHATAAVVRLRTACKQNEEKEEKEAAEAAAASSGPRVHAAHPRGADGTNLPLDNQRTGPSRSLVCLLVMLLSCATQRERLARPSKRRSHGGAQGTSLLWQVAANWAAFIHAGAAAGEWRSALTSVTRSPICSPLLTARLLLSHGFAYFSSCTRVLHFSALPVTHVVACCLHCRSRLAVLTYPCASLRCACALSPSSTHLAEPNADPSRLIMPRPRFVRLLQLGAVALVALFPVFCAGQTSTAAPTTVVTLRAVATSFAATGQPSTGHASVSRLMLEGSGPQWRVVNGVGCLWVEVGEAFSFRFRNELEVADLLHLHGQTPLYTQDGVAYLSSLPAPPNGGQVNYQFNATRAGTYFLHSHVGFHEGNGASIPVIVNAPFPPGYPLDARTYDSLSSVEQIIMKLEDYCPYAAMVGPTQNAQCSDIAAVHRTFVNFADTGDVSTATDGGELQRMATAFNGVGTLPSDRSPYGTSSSSTNAAHDMSNMGGMEGMSGGSMMMPDEHAMLKAGFNFSQCLAPATMPDLIFRYHLVNGEPLVPSPPTVRLAAGAIVRLRIINAASMTNYRLDLGNLTGILIATDGHLIYPDSNNQFWIAVAQRLDILLQLPNRTDVFPLFTTSEFDQQRSGIVLVTSAAGDVPPTTPAYTVQGTDIGLMDDAGMAQEGRLRAFGSTSPAASSTQRDYTLRLTGAMGFMGINEINYHPPTSYNGETVSAPANPAPVLVEQNQRVCLRFVNHNFDGHPMHLHGHVFQVVELNGVSIEGAVRDTVYVPRGNCQTVTVCFIADNPGIHALHCHAALHMMDGMMTTVQYPGFTQMGVLSSGAAAAPLATNALAATLLVLVLICRDL